jgi:hypothetical protein
VEVAEMRIMPGLVIVGVIAGTGAWAQETPLPALLVLHKGENAMAIVDPESGKIAGHVPTGQDPHELAVSADGKLASDLRGKAQPFLDRKSRDCSGHLV